MAKTSIWIVDDHQLFSAGLFYMLNVHFSEFPVRYFRTPVDAEDSRDPPTLILLDFYIPGFTINDWLPKWSNRWPKVPILVISSSTSFVDRDIALELGATGYLPKHLAPEETLDLIQRVLKKPEPIDLEQDLVVSQQLSKQQAEILTQMARGHSNRKIAQLLNISPETVKTHLSTIYHKIGCRGRDQAVMWARKFGYF